MKELIMNSLQGSVFLTGGSGYLSRGIMRRAQQEGWDCQFTCYSRGEEAQRLAKQKYNARYLLGDICDFPRLKLAMLGHDTVLHCAALKFIPQAEVNPSECVRVNVDGSRTVMDAAREAGVKRVVMISTDKTPSPVNIYGATKMIMERLVQETFGQPGDTCYTAVRYGNIVGSSGSVWPVWKQQANELPGHTIKLTDPTHTRYMMGVDQAIDTILMALDEHVPSGLIVLPFPCAIEMGRLASGVAQHFGVKYEKIGARPGEKVHETMVGMHELPRLQVFGDHYLALLPPGVKATQESVEASSLLTSSRPPCWMDTDSFIQLALDSESV